MYLNKSLRVLKTILKHIFLFITRSDFDVQDFVKKMYIFRNYLHFKVVKLNKKKGKWMLLKYD